jgi:Ran GTPase-activating protein (RanGAP) involved in mRNA processing and transport
MLEHNSTLTLLDLSGNQMKAEGAAALADGLKANSTVQQLDASSNSLGNGGAKAFRGMLLGNKTIQTLDVSDNSFGKLQVGDQVKLKSSGEMKTLIQVFDDGSANWAGAKEPPSAFEWEC